MTAPIVLQLRAAGVSVVLEAPLEGLPQILHWGEDLGHLDADELLTLALAQRRPTAPNSPDEPVRVAVLPELHTGWMGRPGILADREGRWVTPRPAFSSALVDGAAATSGTFAASVVDVLATDAVAELGMLVQLELTVSGVLRMRATVRNTSETPLTVNEVNLTLPVPVRAHEGLDFAGQWSRERLPQRYPLVVGSHLRENRRGRTGADAAYVTCVGARGFSYRAGEVWTTHIGFSGNVRSYTERTTTGVQLIGAGEILLPGEIRLTRDQEYTTPWMYGSWSASGLDGAAQRFHKMLRSRPTHPDPTRPATLNVWEAVYFDHRLDRLLELVAAAADVGIERFVLDDGWFRGRRDDTAGLGDWYVDDAVWPDGLSPLADAVRAAGMQFGLWFEPEMLNIDSDLARAHPEWILSPSDRLAVPSRSQQVLDLTNPDAYAYLLERIADIVERYDVAYVKWDHNRDLVEPISRLTGRAAVAAQTRATYRLMSDLIKKFPRLEIESCSSGGARVDLGVLEVASRVWASDTIDALERVQIDAWTAQLIPLELIGSHIGAPSSHTTGRTHGLDLRATTALFGHLGVEWDISRASAEDRARVRRWIDLYKQQRQLLFTGDYVRGEDGDSSLLIQGVVSADASQAIYSVSALSGSLFRPRERLTLPGLSAHRTYRVAPVDPLPSRGEPVGWDGGTVLKGSVLATVGLPIPEMLPETAILLTVSQVHDTREEKTP